MPFKLRASFSVHECGKRNKDRYTDSMRVVLTDLGDCGSKRNLSELC